MADNSLQNTMESNFKSRYISIFENIIETIKASLSKGKLSGKISYCGVDLDIEPILWPDFLELVREYFNKNHNITIELDVVSTNIIINGSTNLCINFRVEQETVKFLFHQFSNQILCQVAADKKRADFERMVPHCDIPNSVTDKILANKKIDCF